jgi:hypothetical protein
MVPHLWVEGDLSYTLKTVFNKRKLDLIPAICEGKEGVCMLNMTIEEISKVLGSMARGVQINTIGNITARITGTDILIEVVSVQILKG